MKDLYKILEIDKSADASIIKKAYKKMAFKHHPDKGGTEAEFKLISEAYEILNDKQKKQTYDKFGYDALQGGNSIEVNPFDLFNNMFSGGMPGMPGMAGMAGMPGMPSMQGMAGGMFDLSDLMGQHMGKQSGQPGQYSSRIEKIEVTLDELYIGSKKTIVIENNIKCMNCSGNGYLNNGKQLCDVVKELKLLCNQFKLDQE